MTLLQSQRSNVRVDMITATLQYIPRPRYINQAYCLPALFLTCPPFPPFCVYAHISSIYTFTRSLLPFTSLDVHKYREA